VFVTTEDDVDLGHGTGQVLIGGKAQMRERDDGIDATREGGDLPARGLDGRAELQGFLLLSMTRPLPRRGRPPASIANHRPRDAWKRLAPASVTLLATSRNRASAMRAGRHLR
jgi:hypothetical protein